MARIAQRMLQPILLTIALASRHIACDVATISRDLSAARKLSEFQMIAADAISCTERDENTYDYLLLSAQAHVKAAEVEAPLLTRPANTIDGIEASGLLIHLSNNKLAPPRIRHQAKKLLADFHNELQWNVHF